MAIPFLGTSDDISSRVRGSGSNLTVTTSGSPYADNDPTQWYGSSFNVSTSNYIDAIGTTSTFAFLHQPESAGTVEGGSTQMPSTTKVLGSKHQMELMRNWINDQAE